MGDLWLLGVDDTDLPDTRGTGRLARRLSDGCPPRGLKRRGVTRHQLLVHPAVRCTSHNSAACVAAEGDVPETDAFFAWACRFVSEQSPPGADPGVCLARCDALDPEVGAFGRRAQAEVLGTQEALALARRKGVRLEAVGGNGDGVVGALAAVGLRWGGNDGRFVDIGRVRDLGGRVRIADVLSAGADGVVASGLPPRRPEPQDTLETFGWVRPRLVGGRAVVLVVWAGDHGADWAVVDRPDHGLGNR